MAGRLGDILVARGWITEEQLNDALTTRGMLGDTLVARGVITTAQLGEALAAQFDVPFQEIQAESVNSQLIRLLPENLSRQRLMTPIGVRDGRLALAMVAPDDMAAISEAELISGYQVEPIVALRRDVLSVLDRGFDERIAARQTIVDIKLQELDEAREESAKSPSVDRGQGRPGRADSSVDLDGCGQRGSQRHPPGAFVPQMRVRYRVDGDLATGHDDSEPYRKRPSSAVSRSWPTWIPPKPAGLRTAT